MPFILPPSTPSGELQYKWLDPTGVLRDLSRNTSNKLFVSAGSVGLGAQTFDISADKYPSSPGSFLRQINTETRTLEIPIVINEESLADAVDVAEEVHEWFDTGDELNQTPGYFRVYRPDGTVRQIAGYYLSGLEGDLSRGGPTWFQSTIRLLCLDPMFTDIEDTVISKSVAQAAAFSVINQGRKDAFPIWKFDGPFVNISLYNATTQEIIIMLITDIGVGEYIIIDTRPSEIRPSYSVYDNTGASRINKVLPGGKYWPLIPGQNNIEQIFTSGTGPTTLTTLTYLARYRSALR